MPDDPVRRPRRRARGRALGVLTGRRLVLLRHGRTADNAGGRIQGQLDTPLDDLGRQQCATAAPLLAALGPRVLLTSDLARARDTARAVGEVAGLVPVPDPRLRELHLGHWQGLTVEEARARFPDEHAAWRRGEDVPRGGGETYRQAGERAAGVLLEHLPADGTLIAVTHGGTARAALGVLLELPDRTWARLAPLGNACWSVLVESSFGWRLEQHNVAAGAVTGGHDLGGSAAQSPDAEPVR